MGVSQDQIVILALTLIFIAGVFMVLREFFCWYWKINERISVQKETNRLLGRLVNLSIDASDTLQSDKDERIHNSFKAER